jgi:hypothetical protein
VFYVQLHKLAHKLVDFAFQTEFILPAVLLDHVKPCSMTVRLVSNTAKL